MIRFTAFLSQNAPTPAAFAAYSAEVGQAEAATAQALLQGHRPKRIITTEGLLSHIAAATQTPAFLLSACLAVTHDKAEVAALLLSAATGPTPTLTEALARMTDPDACLHLARTLPPAARLILFRLATGSFRVKFQTLRDIQTNPGTCLAILTLIDPSGPEATFALPHGNGLVPLTRIKLTLPETSQILTWAKAHTTDRFGPQRQVAPIQVFELAWHGTAPNPRRKCGLDLIGATVRAWRRDLTADQATRLTDLP